jgi:hypothetical protein
MSWTFCTSGSAVAKAGANCNAISGSVATMAKWSDEAEGTICLLTNTDFLTSYAGLNAQIKNALSDACSSYIALSIVQYDPTGYLTREADLLINRNYDVYSNAIKVLTGKANTLKTP